MMTSWNDLKQTEDYLTGKLPPGESLVFNARMIVEPMLRLNVALQRRAYTLIRLYGRKKMKGEMDMIHHKLFNDPLKKEFQQKVLAHFTKK